MYICVMVLYMFCIILHNYVQYYIVLLRPSIATYFGINQISTDRPTEDQICHAPPRHAPPRHAECCEKNFIFVWKIYETYSFVWKILFFTCKILFCMEHLIFAWTFLYDKILFCMKILFLYQKYCSLSEKLCSYEK